MPSFSAQIPLSLYIHIPWCVRKCPYCDFNSHAVKNEIPEAAYVEALLQEFDSYLPFIQQRSFISIFFGGGTPSLFSGKAIQTILQGIRARTKFSSSIEITLEANPGTVDEKHFADFYQAGINRLSLGVQSFNDDHLTQLGRIHNKNQVISAITFAKKSGFTNFNIDLMYGLSQQTLSGALNDLKMAMQFDPPHLSWYQLTLEPNTLFYKQPPPLPTEEYIYEMQLAGQHLLAQHRLQQYEVSAYAKANQMCMHNRNYWEFGDYLGIGAGAHSKITLPASETVLRFSQVKHPKDYLQIEKRLKPQQQHLKQQDLIVEFMLNALRLTHGVNKTLFTERTGLAPSAIAFLTQTAIQKGLLENCTHTYRASALGQRFLNDLIALFL